MTMQNIYKAVRKESECPYEAEMVCALLYHYMSHYRSKFVGWESVAYRIIREPLLFPVKEPIAKGAHP